MSEEKTVKLLVSTNEKIRLDLNDLREELHVLWRIGYSERIFKDTCQTCRYFKSDVSDCSEECRQGDLYAVHPAVVRLRKKAENEF